MRWTTPYFKALQKAWYNRLKESGFEDAEEMIGDEMVLKQAASYPYRRMDSLTIDNKQAYYEILAQKIEETIFPSEIDRIILNAHSRGLKFIGIVEELRAAGFSRGRRTIRVRIRVYLVKWGMRQYTPEQLNRYAKPKAS